MDGFVYQCRIQKIKMWNEVLFPELVTATIFKSIIASGRSPTRSPKDSHRYSTVL